MQPHTICPRRSRVSYKLAFSTPPKILSKNPGTLIALLKAVHNCPAEFLLIGDMDRLVHEQPVEVFKTKLLGILADVGHEQRVDVGSCYSL